MNQHATSAVFRCYRTRHHYFGYSRCFRAESKTACKRVCRMDMTCSHHHHRMQDRLLDRSLSDGRVLELCI